MTSALQAVSRRSWLRAFGVSAVLVAWLASSATSDGRVLGAPLRGAGSFTPQDALLELRPDGSLVGSLSDSMARDTEITFAPEHAGGGIVFSTAEDAFRATEQTRLPGESMTACAWVAIETPRRWGGIVGPIEDNGSFEKGWMLGYDTEAFTFGISTTGTDDGDGRLVWLRANRQYEVGRWYHVAATYDGNVARLYVDGVIEAQTDEASGPILGTDSARLTIGGFIDSDENFPHDGRIASALVADRTLSEAQIQEQFDAHSGLVGTEAWTDTVLAWRVAPYLTWPRPDGVSVMAETTAPSNAILRVREESVMQWTTFDSPAEMLHEFNVDGLEPDTKYFYSMSGKSAIGGREQLDVASPLRSFRTAPDPKAKHQALTFTVLSDTQTQGDVAARVSALAHEHRPDFVVHCGDLVDTGSHKTDWTETFFPSMRPLIEHAPLVPVLGNHEQDARLYYEYMSLPDPERWYSLRYGHAEFFMLDGNRSMEEQSKQRLWLEEALEASTATWRFAVLHQPPYTSDSDDYGQTAEASSTRGDMNVRNIVELLEKHDVDICFSGHVHDYERTFPIKDGEVVPYPEGGVIYVTAAGAGGSLEDFDKTNTWFGHKKMRRHHFLHVAIHGGHLELQAMDEDGRMFDSLNLEKRP